MKPTDMITVTATREQWEALIFELTAPVEIGLPRFSTPTRIPKTNAVLGAVAGAMGVSTETPNGSDTPTTPEQVYARASA